MAEQLGWLERLRKSGEIERYRLLGSLFAQLAHGEWDPSLPDRRTRPSPGEVECAQGKANELAEKTAWLGDDLLKTKEDLKHHAGQLEAEQKRNAVLQQRIDEKQTRLDTLVKKTSDLESELVSKNSRLHQTEVSIEELRLKLQRAELSAKSTSQTDRLEAGNQELVREVESLRAEMAQLRTDKDAEIERLESAMHAAKQDAARQGDRELAKVWQRLALARPPLVEGHVEPTPQAAERLFDAFIALTGFAHDFEVEVRPYLDKYTRDHESMKRYWFAFTQAPDARRMVQSTIAVRGGRGAGALALQLRSLRRWTMAAMQADHAVLESVASRLVEHLRKVLSSDSKATVFDFLRGNGPEHFKGTLLEFHGEVLKKAFWYEEAPKAGKDRRVPAD